MNEHWGPKGVVRLTRRKFGFKIGRHICRALFLAFNSGEIIPFAGRFYEIEPRLTPFDLVRSGLWDGRFVML